MKHNTYFVLIVRRLGFVHARVLCHVGRTIYMGNPACTKRSCYKESFYMLQCRGKTKRVVQKLST